MADMTSQKEKFRIAYDETLSCVRCGYCLPACPTYETMGTETQSPRGRIQLFKAAAEGKLQDLESLAAGIDNCLGCRACETACPSGVKYGEIYESAKQLLMDQPHRSRLSRLASAFLLRGVVVNKAMLFLAACALSFMQALRVPRFARATGLDRLLPAPLRAMLPVLPRVKNPLSQARKRTKQSAALKNFSAPHKCNVPRELTVAFFKGCVMDMLYDGANRASIRLLEKAGCTVIGWTSAQCCGALHAHSGDEQSARRLAKRNIAALEQLERTRRIDYVVNAAGGCGAMLQEYERLLADEPDWRERARKFSAKCVDWSYVLNLRVVTLPHAASESRASTEWHTAIEPVSEKVAYQPSCHMTHVQKNVAAPLALIRSVPGAKLVTMDGADMCCGSAGTYNIVRYKQSMDILDRKMQALIQSGADTVIATNPGCLLQLQIGIHRSKLERKVRAMHLAEWLEESMLDSSSGRSSP